MTFLRTAADFSSIAPVYLLPIVVSEAGRCRFAAVQNGSCEA